MSKQLIYKFLRGFFSVAYKVICKTTANGLTQFYLNPIKLGSNGNISAYILH